MVDVLGVKFHNLDMQQAIERAWVAMEEKSSAYVCTPNPEIVWNCRSDQNLQTALVGASLVLADGVGITLAAKILGTPMKARIPGIDFATALIEQLAKKGKSIFLYGAKPGIAALAAEKLIQQYPDLQIAGVADGYGDSEAVAAEIRQAAPDFLLVCLGSPKQEQWMQAHVGSLNVGLMAGLGGALDVFSGTVKRAPRIWRKLGLEWFYRLCKEPYRIKRMIKLPLFLLLVCKKRIFS